MRKIICIISVLFLMLVFVACNRDSTGNSSFTSDCAQYSSTFTTAELTSSNVTSSQQVTSKTVSSQTTGTSVNSSKTSSFNLNTSDSSRYIDADKDFSGKTTILGRWRCVSKTENGKTTDTSSDETYYIFSSDGTADTEYHGSHMFSYDSYTYKNGLLTLNYGTTSIKLDCVLTKTSLTLSVGNIKTVYERAKYDK